MHVVRGKDRYLISPDDLQTFINQYSSSVLDIGAGDAKGSLRYARAHKDVGVIALDSNFDVLEETSKASMKKPEKGGASNLLCIYSNIRDAELPGVADVIRVYLPWGDLLAGIAEVDPTIVSSISQCGKNNALVEIVINAEIWKSNLPTRLSHLGEITPDFFIDRKDDFQKYGIHITESHLMSKDDIQSLDTTWTAKLMSSRDMADFVMATGVVKQTHL